jgi:hypothetical protein
MGIPKWAEYALGNHVHAQAEIKMHREFFEAWEALHSLPNDKFHRHRAEQAAQKLVDIADAIRRLREITRPINGAEAASLRG